MRLRDRKYSSFADKSNIFDNTYDTAYPQTVVADIVRKHLYDNPTEKKKRVLIYGFDGARADSIAFLLPEKQDFYKNRYSAVAYLKSCGGLYLSYAGGNKNDPSTLQETSTAQGWCSVLTGVWGIENGVVKHTTKKDSVPTILTEGAEKGLSAVFSSVWPDHFTITYKNEIEAAKQKGLPLVFLQVRDENELQAEMLSAIDNGTNIIFGINEFPDANGHESGFSNRNHKYISGIINADRYAAELLSHIQKRSEYENEDWLILITSDHGGHQRRHGTQKAEDRMTFLAVNKKIR